MLATTLMLLFSLTGVGLSVMPVIGDELKSVFHYTDSQIGFLTSVFMLALALTALPAGLAAARFGGRILVVGASLLALGSMGFSLAGSYDWFLAGRLLQGIGAGVTLPSCGAIICQSVRPQFRGRAWGIVGTGVGFGVIVALLALPPLARAAGYRGVFLVIGVLAAAVGGLVLAQPATRRRPSSSVSAASEIVRTLPAVLANRRVLLLALFNVAALAVSVGVVVWTPEFLQIRFGVRSTISAYLTASNGLAQLVANPCGAFFMSRWGKSRVIFVSLALMTLCTALIPLVGGLWAAFMLVTLAGFFSMSYFSPLFAAISEVVKELEQAGAAIGVIEVLGMAGSLLSPWLFGFLLDSLTGNSGYIAGYGMLAVFGLCALLGFAFFRLSAAAHRGPVQDS